MTGIALSVATGGFTLMPGSTAAGGVIVPPLADSLSLVVALAGLAFGAIFSGIGVGCAGLACGEFCGTTVGGAAGAEVSARAAVITAKTPPTRLGKKILSTMTILLLMTG